MNIIRLIILCLLFSVQSFAQQDTIFQSLTATQTDEGVLIKFTIRGGVTCSGVKIERSEDAMNFSEIHEIAGVCGALTTDESYSVTDRNPLKNNVSYYRLDMGSLGLYSDIIPVRYIDFTAKKYLLFPNPCISGCKIYFSNPNNEKNEFLFFNSMGDLITSKIISENNFFIFPENLDSGLYLFQMVRNNEVKFTGKVVIGE